MFTGIALGGQKAAGKDAALDYIMSTRAGLELVRAKTPIVEAFEEYYDTKYDKARDDAKLIHFSSTIARVKNPNIVKEYLLRAIPEIISRGKMPILPDMRFHEENKACYDLMDMLCIKIEASEKTRHERIIRRDGDLRNVVKGDPCDVAVDTLKYHYEVDNNRDDGFKFAAKQVEDYLRRAGANFAISSDRFFDYEDTVRIINPYSGYCWDTGSVHEINGTLKTIGVLLDDGNIRTFHTYELMLVP